MSAVAWKKLRVFSDAPLCDGACRTTADARSVARWRLELMTRPAGNYCEKCRRGMRQAWDSALADPQLEREPQPVAVAA